MFFLRIRFLFIWAFAIVVLSLFSLDAVSSTASFSFQKKGCQDSIIIQYDCLIHPKDKHEIPMVLMVREYGGWQMAHFLRNCIKLLMQNSFKIHDFSIAPNLFSAFSVAVHLIDKEIKKAFDKNVHETAATALITIFAGNNNIWIANVGSCCAAIFSEYKKKTDLTFINEPHIAKPFLGGVLPVYRIFGYPKLLLGSNNDINYKNGLNATPDIISYATTKKDKLLILASCEFFDILSQKKIKKICQKTLDPKQVCDALKEAVTKELNIKNIAVTNVALCVINLSMQRMNDILKTLEDIQGTFLEVYRQKILGREKVLSMKKIFRKFELFLSTTNISDIDDKTPIGDKVFANLESWYQVVRAGLYSDTALLKKFTKEIDRSFDRLLGAVKTSDIGSFLSNEQVDDISLWQKQFNFDF